MSKFGEVFRLSAPLSAAQMAQSVMLFFDTVLFGLLGVAELAGGGLGATVFNFILIVVNGIFATVSAEVAIHVGSKQDNAIARLVKSGLVLTAVVSVLVWVIVQYLPDLLIRFGQDKATVDFAASYLKVVVFVTPTASLFMILRGVAVGMGHTRSIMKISLIGVLINVPVSYALMSGWGGIPALGIPGIALGTIIGSLFMVGMLFLELRRFPDIKKIFTKLAEVSISWQDYAPYWRLGVPIGLAWAMEAGVFTVSTLLAGMIGVAALAAHQIALQTASMSFNLYIGFAQGAAIRTGQCFGQQDFANVKRYTWTGLALGGVFCIFAAGIFILVPEPIVKLFTLGENGQLNDEVIDLGIKLLLVAAFFQVVDGGQVIIMTALRAIRIGMPPTIVTVVSYWGVGFPIAWWLAGASGVVGIWIGLGIGLGFAFVCLTIMFIWNVNKLERKAQSPAMT